MLTAGRGYRRATAGAGRDAAPCAGAFPDALTDALTVSVAATSGGSCAVTPARGSTATSTSSTATPTASTLGQRGGYHQSTDCQAEHESA